MPGNARAIRAIIGWLIFSGCCFSADPVINQTSGTANDTKTPHSSATIPRTFFLVVGKGKPSDPVRLQERANIAVTRVSGAVRQYQPMIAIDILTENIMTMEQYLRGEVEVNISVDSFRKRLQQLGQAVTEQDTVIIYTHTHGSKGSPDALATSGGIVLSPGTPRPGSRGLLSWDEYAELLLTIPARNVVVLAMSCFSGSLVEYLNSAPVKDRWKDRREKEGRNLIILTSQNADLMSTPIMKGGEIINPFTYAVAEAFAGKADGFTLVNGKMDKSLHKDGKLSAGEIIDFILYTTEHTTSDTPQLKNIAKPQWAGSFERDEILLTDTRTKGHELQDESVAQQDAQSTGGEN